VRFDVAPSIEKQSTTMVGGRKLILQQILLPI
jgi:hypothetical protein